MGGGQGSYPMYVSLLRRGAYLVGVTEVYINPDFGAELSTLVLTIPVVPWILFNNAP